MNSGSTLADGLVDILGSLGAGYNPAKLVQIDSHPGL